MEGIAGTHLRISRHVSQRGDSLCAQLGKRAECLWEILHQVQSCRPTGPLILLLCNKTPFLRSCKPSVAPQALNETWEATRPQALRTPLAWREAPWAPKLWMMLWSCPQALSSPRSAVSLLKLYLNVLRILLQRLTFQRWDWISLAWFLPFPELEASLVIWPFPGMWHLILLPHLPPRGPGTLWAPSVWQVPVRGHQDGTGRPRGGGRGWGRCSCLPSDPAPWRCGDRSWTGEHSLKARLAFRLSPSPSPASPSRRGEVFPEK